MKKFEYMEFDNGDFVFDKKQFTKEKALEIAKEETDIFDDMTAEDVKEGYVAYRFDPSYCKREFDSLGAYFYVPEDSRGSFEVWVVQA
jgi:hypothetical protein